MLHVSVVHLRPRSRPSQSLASGVAARGGSHVPEKPIASSQSHRQLRPASNEASTPNVARKKTRLGSPGTLTICCARGKRPFARAAAGAYAPRALAARTMNREALMTRLYLASLLLALSACRARRPPDPKVLGGAPVPIARSAAAYITDNGSDTISVIDRDGDRVVSRSVDVDPTAHEAPHHLAIDGAGHLFVALAFPPDERASGKHAGHGGSDSLGQLLRLDASNLALSAAVDVDQNPGDVVLTHDRKRVLVTHFDMRRARQQAKAGGSAASMMARLSVFDATTLRPLGARAVCVAPHGIALTKDDREALIACYGSDEIAFVELDGALALSRAPLGQRPAPLGAPSYGPYSIAVSPDGAIAAVADLESADVRVMDIARRLLGDPIAMGGRAMMPDFAADRVLLVPLQGPDGLARVDLDKRAVEAHVSYGDECKSPHVARVAPDGRAYVVCEGDHASPGAVLEVDPVTLATKRRWTVGVYPDGIAFGDAR